jgi:hypothetical protein
MPIQARDQVSYVLVYMLIGALMLEALRAIALGELTKNSMVTATLFAVTALVSGWIKAVQSRRRVEIDPQTGHVTIYFVSAFFSSTQIRYPLEQFGSVRSYITIGRFPKNYVELVTRNGGEALIVAAFAPTNGASSFWSFPTDTESAKAMHLRKEISSQCGLIDGGFLGSRMVGALIGTPTS